MSYYEDVYLRRINRFGTDTKSRIQGQREKVFEDLLVQSIYRVDFVYQNVMQPGLLERYREDDTKTLQYLLTRVDLNIPAGTILTIPDKDLQPQKWMVLYLEYIEASGYNRYFVISVKTLITGYHTAPYQTADYSEYGYFYGPHNAAIRDVLFGKKTEGRVWEDNSNYFIIMPLNVDMKKEDYFEVTVTATDGRTMTRSYRIVGIDIQSNPGVAYVTVDPIYQYDKSSIPVKPQGSTDAGYDWFTGEFGGTN